MKKRPILQVGGPAPAPPTLPVIRVVLPHTEACDPTLLQPHCMYVTFSRSAKFLIIDVKVPQNNCLVIRQ